MVNAQEWLDSNYPKKKRSEIEEIYLTEPDLVGKLDLSEFTYKYYEDGIRIYISHAVDETKLDMENLSEYAEIIKLKNAQNYILHEYPTKEIRMKVTELEINYILEGDLDLSDFTNCQKLSCYGNKLTLLNLSKCSRLKEVLCSNNWLINLDVSHCFDLVKFDCSDNSLIKIDLPQNLTNLKILDISNNNFPAQDLFFLIKAINLEEIVLDNNNFVGSLDYLVNMKNLKELNVSNTDLNDVNLNKLPKSLERIYYSIDQRPTCQLNKIISQLKKIRNGWCQKCQQPNSNYKQCQVCFEKEWQNDLKQLTGKELIEKFIKKQELRESREHDKLQWIPYEKFVDIKYLAEGGFSKIYKANWESDEEGENKTVILKILTNSQDITLEFLNEISNTKLVDNGAKGITHCYGISQDPKTNNYVMIIQYMEGGNLRECLQQKIQNLNLKDRIDKLYNIILGLSIIHNLDLVHRDIHPGNILSGKLNNSINNLLFITDLGLSRPADSQKEEGKIFGVLPYVAPEVLQGQPYTQASDIYSWGVVAAELLTGLPPFYDQKHDVQLGLAICQGLRPNFQIKIPQLLMDLISRCWADDYNQRPTSKELYNIIRVWNDEIKNKKSNTVFVRQCKSIEKEYNLWLQSINYQISPNTITCSKQICTKEIIHLFQESQEQKALELELKKIEKEINQELTNEIKWLISEFIQNHKKKLKNRKDKEVRNKFKELKEQLTEKCLSDENIEKIMKYCERFIDADQKLKEEKLEANIEIPTNKY